MTPCPSIEDLAEVASGEAVAGEAAAGGLVHAESCETCRAVIEEQREVRRLALALPAPARMSASRRESLAASTLALAERDAPQRHDAVVHDELAALALADRRRREAAVAERVEVVDDAVEAAPVRGWTRWIVAGAAAAALAGFALAATLAPRGKLPGDAVAAVEWPVEQAPREVAEVAELGHEVRERVAVALSAATDEPTAVARVDAAHARIDRVREGAADVIRLHEGTVTVDARGATPVAVAMGETRVGVGAAAVSVAAKNGAIQTVTVVAGSVEIVDRGRTFIVAAGDIWERDASADAAFAAFREGWTLLRAGNDREAIAAFDRATHRDIAEDAAYWAAVASERAGDKAGAVRRFDDFLARFPRSPRADGARGALDRLR